MRLISTENRGLSAARNTGWQEATGEIVAYIDDDAYPDPHWLHYLAYRFMTGDWVGVGGPNIAPPGDGPIADCVANAPGGPVHVLVSDTEAEHIPGCNMAFRRDALAAIGGFDPRYRAAGDDVDVCWRLQERGGRIGFHAGAHGLAPPPQLAGDVLAAAEGLRQGRGAAGGEVAGALQRARAPRVDGAAVRPRASRCRSRSGRSRVYGGVWGSAAYQSLYEPAPATLLSLPLMPEWYLLDRRACGGCRCWACRGRRCCGARRCSLLAAAAPIAQAALAASRAQFPVPAASASRAGRSAG